MDVNDFTELIWQKGRELYRDMPWRRDTRPYYVLVSELMLQQTQVSRVMPKFNQFIARFPTEAVLAEASLADVLKLWQGLGYNRRAKYLHEAAKKIVGDYAGVFPAEEAAMLTLPGVGRNTAGALMAYAYNQPVVFVETNIRSVIIHHFFNDQLTVDDSAIREKVEMAIDHEHPRQFYWALMDYGSWLKANGVRNISQSKHYKRQSPLEGSVRQMRGMIIRVLAQRGSLPEVKLREQLNHDERFEPALQTLKRDGLVTASQSKLYLTDEHAGSILE